MCPAICKSTHNESNDTDFTFGADFLFFYKMQEVNHFFNFCTTKTPGSAKKIKKIINKSNFIFIPVLEKLGTADFVNQKNKK